MKRDQSNFRPEEIGRGEGQWVHLGNEDLPPLPAPLDDPAREPDWRPIKEEARSKFETSLDDTLLLNLPKPAGPEEEQALVRRFLAGLEKLFSREDNWTFLRPLALTLEHCAGCQTCAEACHIFQASGRHPVYRPTLRAELLRRIYRKYLKPGGRFFAAWRHGQIDLNWRTVARLAELSYRCNLCRRCAQTCPIGADNGLVARELRKLFSQEFGLQPQELHRDGSALQLAAGSSTGMSPAAVRDSVEFIDEETSELTGLEIETPWDVKGAEILLIHNAGEFLSWPENPGAFAAIFQAAGLSWTLSSAIAGYDAVNYGLWYDDAMLAKVALRHAQIARDLGVRKIVIGECGHAHKALAVTADRILTGDLNIPRESAIALLADLVEGGRLELDPARNDFPVTLHDPCNMVRLMGVVDPQRRILRRICPGFREMVPHGVDNYCCGGGSGFAIESRHNFEDWRFKVAGRRKMEQILSAFADCIGPETNKYVCAPCSNCKGQIRDILAYYGLWESNRLFYGGLAELIVNAMVAVKPGYLRWEWR